MVKQQVTLDHAIDRSFDRRNLGDDTFAVDDVDAQVKKAQANGAKLMQPIFDVPGVGRIAVLTEPGGARIGWITPAPK